MPSSMTGFSRTEGLAWAWELRSVNGRGLELRFRLPPGFDAHEPALREAAAHVLKRGNVTANLAVARAERSTLVADPAALDQVLALAQALAARIPDCPPPRAEALLALPGVLRRTEEESDAELAAARGAEIITGFAQALEDLVAARRAEGGRLAVLLGRQLDELARLHAQASLEAVDQPAQQRARMTESLDALLRQLGGADAIPGDRVAQEIALLAAKSDVREELDRLDSHIAAAHALLAETAPIGRRFDFLVQEFNREANTLCSKSASVQLTATGLHLKAAIEQLREQVQNIE